METCPWQPFLSISVIVHIFPYILDSDATYLIVCLVTRTTTTRKRELLMGCRLFFFVFMGQINYFGKHQVVHSIKKVHLQRSTYSVIQMTVSFSYDFYLVHRLVLGDEADPSRPPWPTFPPPPRPSPCPTRAPTTAALTLVSRDL